ncbi:MAG: hypothetical protein V4693_13100 [Pseudomonadota bacterium]
MDELTQLCQQMAELLAKKKSNPISDERIPVDLRQAAKTSRLRALRRVAGIWADRLDIPADGLQYERELRDEWR